METSNKAHYGKVKPKLAFAKEEGKDMDRLSREALEASKKGISYGQLKAQQMEAGKVGPYKSTTPLILEPKAKVEVVCTVCGNTFLAVHRSRKYCSEGCKNKAWRDRQAENKGLSPKEAAPKICHTCGREIVNRLGATKYCSKACCDKTSAAAYANRQKEAQRNGTE